MGPFSYYTCTYYTWVTSITMVSRLTRVTCQNHIIQALRSLLLHNHYDQTDAVYQSMITTSNGSFPYLAFVNFSFPHVLKQSVKQFFTCSSYGAKNNISTVRINEKFTDPPQKV